MAERVQTGGLDVAAPLHRFVEEEALPGTGLESAMFWDGVAAVIDDLAPAQQGQLLAKREEIQAQLDTWHREHPGTPDAGEYTAFLREIGYLLDEPAEVAVSTSGVDDEVATHRRPPARRTAAERALRHQRGQRPLGLAVRRPLRHRRRPARGRPRSRRRLQQDPRRRGHPPRPRLPRRALPPRLRLARRRDVVRRGRRGRRRDAQGRRRPPRRPRPARRLPRRGRDARRPCC